ncbi:MAG: ABC transporter permease subunit [Elusimicrobiota bacterium]|jgi:ABC-2 type transport system permease protein
MISMKTRRHPALTLARKEWATLFNSPATYVIFVFFLLVSGWLFASPLFQFNQSALDTFLRPIPILFTFMIPALTMRSFAEEYRSGTMEYLATLPMEDHQIVLGKYLGAMGLIGALLILTLIYPILLLIIGQPDPGQIVGGYVAVIGLASFFSAIGLWASALTRNQVVAFIIGFAVCFSFFSIDWIANMFPSVVGVWIQTLGIQAHYEALTRGVLDSRDLLYWASGTIFFLAASLAVIHSRRWR